MTAKSHGGQPNVRQLKNLSKSERRRVVWSSTLRMVIGMVVLFGIYWAAPLQDAGGIHPLVVFALMLISFLVLSYFSIRSIMHTDFPQLKAAQVAVLTVTFYLVAFAALYLSMSILDPAHFTEPLSHVGAFYFTVTVASTVGFGDITAADDVTRMIVTGQMLINIALIGVGVRAILAIGKMRVAKADPGDTNPLPDSI